MSNLVEMREVIDKRIKLLPENSSVFVVVDGKFESSLSQLRVLPKNIVLNDCSHGLALEIPENIVVDNLICFLAIFTAQSSQQTYDFHNKIIVNKFAAVKLFEDYVSVNDADFTCNVVTDLDLLSNSKVEFYKAQNLSIQTSHAAVLQVKQNQFSNLKVCHVLQGCKKSQEDLHINLIQEHAVCDLSGLYLAHGKQEQKINLRVEHLVPNCSSKELYKGVVSDEANATFVGRVFVAENAKQSEAHLTNRNLLLNDQAQVSVAPEMEIYADDVKCTHGASIGQLDEQMLFYLRTRGIDLETAKELLLQAFQAEILQKFII